MEDCWCVPWPTRDQISSSVSSHKLGQFNLHSPQVTLGDSVVVYTTARY